MARELAMIFEELRYGRRMRLFSFSLLTGAISGVMLALGCGGNEVSPSGAGGGTTTSSASTGSGGSGGERVCPTSVEPGPGVVLVREGAVKGIKKGKTWVYKGVPYAAPPVGALRWKRPVAHACWDGALAATDYGAMCAQLDDMGAVKGSEDCLTMNLWVPADASADKPVPVLFFIHGGGNVQGSSSVHVGNTALYDGQALSELGHVAVVTLNYRLGPFGWLAHPALAEGEPAASGNYGALDQVFALRWAKENLPAFRADPSRLMVFGESAGGQNTCTLLASPLAKGLFSSALIESGGCAAERRSDAEAFAATWAEKAGCAEAPDLAACLRALPAGDVATLVPSKVEVAGKQGPYQPIVDGYLLAAPPLEVIEGGAHNHVPVVMGANEHETGASVPGAMSEAEYEAAVKALLPSFAAEILAHYPASSFPTPRDAFVAVTSDAKFICPVRRTLRALAKAQAEPVYRYHFTHVLDNVGPAQKQKGAFHGLELFFVFGQLDVAGYKPSPGEKGLALAIQTYWTRFGATGSPTEEGRSRGRPTTRRTTAIWSSTRRWWPKRASTRRPAISGTPSRPDPARRPRFGRDGRSPPEPKR
jgi:para-nitrobenzyl esterase